MPITLVQKKPADATGANGSVTLDAPPTAGNLVVVVQRVQLGNAAVTEPTGYPTQVERQTPNGNTSVRICQRTAQAGDSATIAFTHISAIYSIEAYEFAGTKGTVDQFTSASNASTTSQQPGSLTPSMSSELFVVASNQGDTNGGTEAIDSSFTMVDSGSFNRLITGYKIKTDALAENPTASWTTTRQATTAIGCWKPIPLALPFAPPRIRRPLLRSAT